MTNVRELAIATLCAASLTLIPNVALAENAAIEDLLKGRQLALPTAAYKLKTELVISKGRFGNDAAGLPVPASDHTLARIHHIVVDIPKQRIWSELVYQTWFDELNAFRPDYLLTRFDGVQLIFARPHDRVASPLYTPTAATPEVSIRTKNIQYADVVDVAVAPILWNHGVLTSRRGMLPLGGAWLEPGGDLSRSKADPKVIVVNFAGKEETPDVARDEFDLSVKDGAVITEWRRFRDGVHKHRVRCELERVENHVISKRWAGFRLPNRKPEFTTELMEFRPNCKVDDDLFVLDFKEGMRIVHDGIFSVVPDDN